MGSVLVPAGTYLVRAQGELNNTERDYSSACLVSVNGERTGPVRQMINNARYSPAALDIERLVTLSSPGQIEMACYGFDDDTYIADYSLVAWPVVVN
ncbi:hypothetical protein [Microbacterium sp. B35-30]|uniref:hypothetical protein n=1 Tax=Microbacterium sp. B35-30 TaxID=1962642 RepID=UPI0013D021CF|nr:hypothetical protein [Microbacterium sp. B35-30]KAF2417147.1 hypothetical protein B2K11_13055 [Microbacterium sp. B35-30]